MVVTPLANTALRFQGGTPLTGAAKEGEILALVEQQVAFGELPDHLLGHLITQLHAVLLAPFWSIESAWVSRRLHTLEERMESWIRSRQDRRGIRLR